MVEQPKAPEDVVLTRLLRLNAMVHGIVTGMVTGVAIFLATNWLVIKGGPRVGQHLVLLRQFFLGYRVTLLGSLIGFAYGFVIGFACGYLVARLYNWLVELREKKRQRLA
jgi:hypothetical protein